MSKDRKNPEARKRHKKPTGGYEMALQIEDLSEMLADKELYQKVEGGKELVVSLDLPEEPSQQDLVAARNLRDAVDDLIEDIAAELSDEDEETEDDEDSGEDDVDEEDEDLDEEDEEEDEETEDDA